MEPRELKWDERLFMRLWSLLGIVVLVMIPVLIADMVFDFLPRCQ